MHAFSSWKNRTLSRVLRHWPGLVRLWARRQRFTSPPAIPWTPLQKPLHDCKVALITTAGVHLRTQVPFDMQNPQGDPSFREIPAHTSPESLTITHDYYDHRDADQDVNIVLPIERLQELANAGEIGAVAPVHLGFMGHIDGDLVDVLCQQTAPAAAACLAGQQVDVVLLFPA